MKPVQKTDLPNLLPMPAQQTTVLLNRTFAKDRATLLKLGFLPLTMEDKWFIYFENNTLHFHRSWTGVCIYQVFCAEEANGTLRITRATLNRDPEQYSETRDARDVEMISQLINAFLLQRD
jgi:hypothetical protein